MPDVGQLLQQLEQTEVAPPSHAAEAEIWDAIVDRLVDRPWWDRFRPAPGFGRTVLVGVGLAAAAAALVAIVTVVAADRSERRPPVIDQIELPPVPAGLIGDALPPFRATVHIQPVVGEPDRAVWEVSYDGSAGFRWELVDAFGGFAPFRIGSYAVTDGRLVGYVDGESTAADGTPLFRIAPVTFALAEPWSFELTWAPWCDAPQDGSITVCTDWRGTEYDVGHDPDSGLVTFLRGPLDGLKLRNPFQARSLMAVGLPGGAVGAISFGGSEGELRVVDVEWGPDFEPETFAVTAPEGTTPLHTGQIDEVLTWRQDTGPPATTFSFTVEQRHDEVDAGEAAPSRVTWRFDHDPDRGWRAEAVRNDDPAWDRFVGTVATWDGETQVAYDPISNEVQRTDSDAPPHDPIRQVLATYLDDAIWTYGHGNFDAYLATACQPREPDTVVGVTADVHVCAVEDVTETYWVHQDTGLVLRSTRSWPGDDALAAAPPVEVSRLDLEPDLDALDVAFEPPPDARDADHPEPTTLRAGELAPSWRSATLAGELDLDDLRGAPALLLFQHDLCPVHSLRCRAFDHLLALQDDVTTVWVARTDLVDVTRTIIDRRGFTGHTLLDDFGPAGPMRAWGVEGQVWDPETPTPLWVLLDAEGRVELATTDELGESDLREAIERLS